MGEPGYLVLSLGHGGGGGVAAGVGANQRLVVRRVGGSGVAEVGNLAHQRLAVTDRGHAELLQVALIQVKQVLRMMTV